MPLDIARLEELEQQAQERLDPASDNYDDMVASLSRLGSIIDTHYKGQRKVDDTGKLTEDAPTRQPARVGEGESDYFFEPNVREVQAFFKRNPDALDRLRDSHGQPLRGWAEGEAQAEIRSPMFDPQTQAVTGFNVTPGKSHLDQLSEDQEPYKVAAEEMWRLATEDATKKGKGLKRYRDIKLDTTEWKDYIEGGIKKGVSRIVAPAALGVADSMTAGQASPLYDALGDLAEYRQARMPEEEKATARAFGYDPSDSEDMASSEDIQNRSMPAYITGNIAGYSLPGNPANTAQKIIQEGLGYSALKAGEKGVPVAARNVVERAGIASVAGAGANAAESALGDMARYANEGEPIPVGDVALNAAKAGAVGLVGGGAFDLAGQGFGGLRSGFRKFERNAPLRTLEEAGGRADVGMGFAAPTEIQQAYDRMHSVDPNRPPTTAGGELSAELAPHLEQSAKKRSLDEQARSAAEMKEYYNHPAYRDRKVSAAPAVHGLIDMATRGLARAPIDGSIMPMNPRAIDEIGGILRDYSQPGTPVPSADAQAIARATGGVVVDGELANRLYGFKPDDPNAFRPGTVAVVRPVEINAQKLTELEGRIDTELSFAKTPGGADEPVWKEFNAHVKAMRDEFPAYRDADGKLVEPPPPDPEPFAPADDIPRGPSEGKYLAPPRDVYGPPPPKPEGALALGPPESFGPPVPENPFDPRLPTSRESINPQPTVGVRGDYAEPGYVGPEANPGVGPNYQPPNDPRRLGPPVSARAPMDVQGTYGEPEHLPPAVLLGPGPRRDAPRFSGASPDALRPNQTVDVSGGDYSKPQRVQPDEPPAVDTPRMPLGMPEQPKALTDDEYSALGSLPGERNPLAPSAVSEESLARLAGTERSDELAAAGMDIEPKWGESLADFEARGGKTGWDLPPEVQAKVDDGTLTTEAQQKANRDRIEKLDGSGPRISPLERDLDAQLDAPGAPRVPKTEIEEAGVRQTADREQVAQNQKAYVEEIFAPGREARAAQVEQVRALGEHPEVIEEAIAAVKKVDERLGPLSQEDKRAMVVSMIEKKLGRKIDPEDLIRFGLISAGLVSMSSDDDTGSAVGAGILSFGLGKGKKGSQPEAPKGRPKPTQPKATLDDGRVVEGFSAMRNEQHTELEAIEKAMKRLGVGGDNTLENRIRTYGQLEDRKKIDEALFGEAKSIDEASKLQAKKNTDKGEPPGEVTDRVGELRRAAGANAYPGLRGRAWPGGTSRSVGNAVVDMFLTRGYRVGEYLSGRFNREFERNPFIRGNDTTSSKMQQTLLEEPARRLLNLTGGGPAARLSGKELWELYDGNSEYESKEDYEKKQLKKRNKEANP